MKIFATDSPLITIDEPILERFDYTFNTMFYFIGVASIVVAIPLAVLAIDLLSGKRKGRSFVCFLAVVALITTSVFSIVTSITSVNDWDSNADKVVSEMNNKLNSTVTDKYGISLDEPEFFDEIALMYKTEPFTVTEYATTKDGEQIKVTVETDMKLSNVIVRDIDEIITGKELSVVTESAK